MRHRKDTFIKFMVREQTVKYALTNDQIAILEIERRARRQRVIDEFATMDWSKIDVYDT